MPQSCKITYELHGTAHSLDLEGDRVVIGRSEDCDVAIPDESVSRIHAVIERQGNRWQLRDQQSRNGTYLNWQKVDTATLGHDDRVTLGRIEIVFQVLGRAGGVYIQDEDSVGSRVDQTLNVHDFQQMLQDSTLTDTERGSPQPVTSLPGTGVSDDPAATEDRAVQWTVPLFSRATEVLISSSSLDEMLDELLDVIFTSLPADRGCIFLFDQETGENAHETMRTRSANLDSPFVISRTIARQAIENKNAVIVMDSFSDEALANQQSIILNQIQSAICAPLYHDGQVIGLIYLDSQRLHRRFEKQHLEVLTTLALLTANGVQQIELRKKVREEQQMRRRLERYSAPSVVDRIVNSDRGGQMFSEEIQASVLFVDIVQFTALAEEMGPSDVIQILNGIFTELTECVFRFEGTLDKFTGDGLMAVFGAPLPQENHAERAVRAALEMQSSLVEYNESHAAQLAMRIGINSGPVVAGDIGSPRRKDYTVIGDTVNVASRLESQVAQPGQVVIGPETYTQVRDLLPCEELGTLSVKGKKREVLAYRVLPGPPAQP